MTATMVQITSSALLLGSLFLGGAYAGDDIIELGTGSYHGSLPEDHDRPVDSSGNPVQPRITEDFDEPSASNDWSSSIIFPRHSSNGHGEAMFPWPIACKAFPYGLRIDHSPALQPTGNGYTAYLGGGITVGIDGLHASETRLAAQGDWTVTTEWRDADQALAATFGRGLPYAWFETGGDGIVITGADDLLLIEQTDARVVFSTNGGTYAAFAPTGATWRQAGSTLRSGLAGAGWVVVAILPDTEPGTIDLFDQHARARVVDTIVAWEHVATDGTMLVTYSFVTEPLEGTETRTLTGLFPHQSPWTDAPTTDLGYDTARGRMNLTATEAFTLALPTAPILPGLPLADGIDVEAIRADLMSIAAEQNSISAPDSYWSGKQLGRIAQAAHIADLLGETMLRDELIDRLKVELENWFSVDAVTNDDRIEAEAFDSSIGVTIGAGEDGGLAVHDVGGGDRIRWNDIDLGDAVPTRVLMRFASGVGTGGSALIQLRAGGDEGSIIGEAAVGDTGGWDAWTTVPLGVSEEAVALLDGTRELVLRCDTNHPDDVLDIDWIEWDIPGSGGGVNKTLAYDPDWSTLLPSPGSYGIASELNDHHFHYGYLVAGAATIARFDPEWAATDRWGGMVDLLISDVANWDRQDDRFPFLRNLDPYMGHSYASGHAAFAAGNNQESSSESMNFAQAVALWGASTGRTELHDLGIFLHALEAQAIEQYWFDVDETVFPDFMPHAIGSIIWDAGAAYATWWTGNVEEIHGINLLPLTGGSLYLGRRQDAMERAWDHMISENPGLPTVWQDILWSWRSLFDPSSALAWLETDDSWSAEAGSSRAHVGFWIRNLAALGTLQSDLRADTPHAAVFDRDGQRTYVVWNEGSNNRIVHFSDGMIVCVAPGETLATGIPEDCLADADLDGNGLVNGADLTLLLGNWGECAGTGCTGDLDGDQRVDGQDLAMLLAGWS